MDIESRIPANIAEKSRLLNEETKINDWEKLKETVSIALQSRARKVATEQIVKYIHKYKHIHTTRSDEKPEMWYYVEGIYKPNGKTYIQELCREIYGDESTNYLINEVISKVQHDTFIESEDLFDNQNKYPYLIPLQNGILNIKTRELTPFTPNIFFFNKLPVKYNPDATCKKVEKFIMEIVDSKETYSGLQEIAGYSLLKEYKFEKAFMFLGYGRNGKSKFLEVLSTMLGKDNTTNIDLSAMEKKDGFALAGLHNKMVNIAAEISSQALQDTGNFKAATGNDILHANRKFKTPIKFKNYAKMIFTANNLPPTKDLTQGFFDRWVIVDFPYNFIPQKEIDMLPEDARTNVRLQNPDLIKTLTTEDQLEGFLNWCLDGFDKIMDSKSFSTATNGQITKTKWIQKSDSATAFIQQWMTSDYNSNVIKSDLKRVYIHYCHVNKLTIKGDKTLKDALEIETGASTRRVYEDGKNLYFWEGLKFKQGVLEEIKGLPFSNITSTAMYDLIKSNKTTKPIMPLECLNAIAGYEQGLNIEDLNLTLQTDERELSKLLTRLVVLKQITLIDKIYMIAKEGWEYILEQDVKQ